MLDAVVGGVIWEEGEVSLTELPGKEGDVLVVLFMSFASCSDLSWDSPGRAAVVCSI